MGIIFYNLFLVISLPVVLPALALQALLRPEYRIGLSERFGRVSGSWARKTKRQIRVWIHAASVGEYRAVRPLIDRYLAERPDWDLVLSVVTPAGRRLAREQLGSRVRIHFLPMDLPMVASRFLSRMAPDIILLVETELWPNLIHSAARMAIPIVLVNGRISPRAFSRYRAVRWLFRGVLRQFREFYMQTALDSKRIIELGAPPERVRVLGNLKYDQDTVLLSDEESRSLRKALGWDKEERIWVAGSTREQEEEILLECYARLKEHSGDLRLILAPRHIHRIPEIVELLERSGRSFLKYSELDSSPTGKVADILLVDTMGPLGKLYGLGTLTFVGGTLVPAGGHNLLEPVLMGRPVLFGPHLEHVQELAHQLMASGAGRRVQDGQDLVRKFEALIETPEELEQMARRGRELIGEFQGVTQKLFKKIDRHLDRYSFRRPRLMDRRSFFERWFKNRILESRGGIMTPVVVLFLRVLSYLFLAGQGIRRRGYAHGILSSFRLGRPVISVGNLTLGGTGKTPAVMAIARILLGQGVRPAILSRGYGGQHKGKPQVLSASGEKRMLADHYGDEPCLMAVRLPEVSVVVSRDRVAAGRYAVDTLQADALLLDDGYQHLRLRRDLNLLVLDSTRPFGNGYVFPRGVLREPVGQLKRADTILLTHVTDPADTLELQRLIHDYRPGIPIFTSRHRLAGLTHLTTGQTLPLEKIKRNRIMAVAGIAHPDSFFRMLQEVGAEISTAYFYADHYRYKQKDLADFEKEAHNLNVSRILTTEKDAVRLKDLGQSLDLWWVVRMEMEIDHVGEFEKLISKVLQ